MASRVRLPFADENDGVMRNRNPRGADGCWPGGPRAIVYVVRSTYNAEELKTDERPHLGWGVGDNDREKKKRTRKNEINKSKR